MVYNRNSQPSPGRRRGWSEPPSRHRGCWTSARRRNWSRRPGMPFDEWPLVIAKELFDNALDACEEAGIAPEITVRVDDAGISIADNGPGLPARTIKSILDFSSRTSSREAYVSPTRGAQGNALKTIVAMPFVLSGGERGVVEIDARASGTASSSPSTRSGRRRRSAMRSSLRTVRKGPRSSSTGRIQHAQSSTMPRRVFYKLPTTTPGSTRT